MASASARWAWVEYMLAQGGARAGLAALAAWEAGGSFAAWKRAFGDDLNKQAVGDVGLPKVVYDGATGFA